MGRPAHGLSAAQVKDLRAASSALGHAMCAEPSCPNRVADDGAGSEGGGLCPLHRQQLRNAEGRCPNCGGTMQAQPIVNSLTGLPRTSGGVPMTERACVGCGYTQRERKGGRRRG